MKNLKGKRVAELYIKSFHSF